eukprot:4071244-Prymnesium_polylepis.1
MRRPADYLPLFEEGLRETVQLQDPSYSKHVPLAQLHIGVQGSFGAHHVSPRGLSASRMRLDAAPPRAHGSRARPCRSVPAPLSGRVAVGRCVAAQLDGVRRGHRHQVLAGAAQGAEERALLRDDRPLLDQGARRPCQPRDSARRRWGWAAHCEARKRRPSV